MMSAFPLKQNVDVLSHVNRGPWKCFGFSGRGEDEMTQLIHTLVELCLLTVCTNLILQSL
jgi:hypothetical protein